MTDPVVRPVIRPVVRQHPALRDDIGDLVTRRPVPGPGLEQMDPFLFLNHHGPQVYPPNNRGLPFGPHPHRGFETVTFILDGELAHNDSADGESIIKAGGIQWMTAGSGLIHAELSPAAFKRDGGPMEILQLWVNLPSRLKMTKPDYVGLQAADIPSFTTDEGRVTVEPVSGVWGDVNAPIQSLIDIQLAVLKFKAGGVFEAPMARGRTVFLYVVAGKISVGGTPVEPWNLIALGDGDTVKIEATSDAVILLGHAEPIAEPVASHGPFVMNTREEIIQAITDYNAGKFGPPPRV
ncbi:pirin family protein [Brevundimonas goettingensis]|uniref:Pirin family protein n=1 Tax=Brevundimonas goettingensis TaxID=2774190 RepID=A0A975GVN2_9CAUL|nr:pirin family protein [Brevundimonas goettingensis]QTC90789.1 pirin family protein [Brevundimonas goettingensis]